MGREAPFGVLAPWQLEWSTSGADLAAYRQLLGEQATLSERDDILPFFRRHADLAALLGTYHPNIERYDRLGVEVPLFGECVAARESYDHGSEHHPWTRGFHAAVTPPPRGH